MARGPLAATGRRAASGPSSNRPSTSSSPNCSRTRTPPARRRCASWSSACRGFACCEPCGVTPFASVL